MPDNDWGKVVRVNDGNDSSIDFDLVCKLTSRYTQRFFNTISTRYLAKFPGPVVLTVNPGKLTTWAYAHLTTIPKNLMFIRVLTNTWNLNIVHSAVEWYASRKVPIILTFMAYHDIESIPRPHRDNYSYRKRTTNSYHAIKTSSWAPIMARFLKDPFVYSCGSEGISSLCRHCGNCLREYFVTMERMNREQTPQAST
jgi:hypothetical protein